MTQVLKFPTYNGFLFADFRYSIVRKIVCFSGYFAFVVGGGVHAAVVAYVVAYVVVVAVVAVVVVAVDTAAAVAVVAVAVAVVVAADVE